MKSKDTRPQAQGCTGCGHWRPIMYKTAQRPLFACYFCLDTGKVRGCPARECNKKMEVSA